jgi:hypothetical protein
MIITIKYIIIEHIVFEKIKFDPQSYIHCTQGLIET